MDHLAKWRIKSLLEQFPDFLQGTPHLALYFREKRLATEKRREPRAAFQERNNGADDSA